MHLNCSDEVARYVGTMLRDAPSDLIAMDGDTALAHLRGRVDIEAAIERRTVTAAGETGALLRMVGAGSPLPDVCERVLRREGRSDPLAPAG